MLGFKLIHITKMACTLFYGTYLSWNPIQYWYIMFFLLGILLLTFLFEIMALISNYSLSTIEAILITFSFYYIIHLDVWIPS